jgi:hypothetical protein
MQIRCCPAGLSFKADRLFSSKIFVRVLTLLAFDHSGHPMGWTPCLT